MKLSNKIGVFGIVIAIIGIILTVVLDNHNVESTVQNTSGDNSPTISKVNGNITITNTQNK